MCPVRALWIYLHCTARSCGQIGVLFVQWDEGRAQHPVLKCWINASLTEAICSACGHLGGGGEQEILHANPHLIWGISASWAKIARVSASEIYCAVTWKGTCTFAKHDHLGLLVGSFKTEVLITTECALSGQSWR